METEEKKFLIIQEEIFQKEYDGIQNGIQFKDLPVGLLPTDVIDIVKEDAYYSENNSYEARTTLHVCRERYETEAEFDKRKIENDKFKEELRKRRFEQYKKLKNEFE